MLRQLIRRHRAALFAALILSGASGGVSVTLLAKVNSLAATGLSHGDLHPISIGLVELVVLFAVGALSGGVLARLGANMVAELRLDMSMRFLAIDYERLANRKHLVLGALIADIGRLGPLVLLMPQLAYNAILVVVGYVYVFGVSAPLFGVLCVFHGLTLTVGWIMERSTRARFGVLRQAEDQVFKHFRALSEGKKEFTLSQARSHHFMHALLRPAIIAARDLMYRVHLGWGLANSASNVLSYGASFGVIIFGHIVLGAPVGSIVKVVISGLFLAGPVNFLVHAGPQVASGRATLRHLAEVGFDLNAQLEAPSSAISDAGLADWQILRAQGLCYHYPAVEGDVRSGVGPIDLLLRRGETLFITGGNGSGKSTLLLMLCGLLRANSGTLELDGRSVWDEPARYRHRFATIFSDFFLFAHVLDGQGNLLPDAQITDLLKRLGLQSQVRSSEGALSKLDVSTGQRKRLALLHCYAQDRDILVLDEWAADQDPLFRERFYHELLPELKRQGKTLLVISHDDRYFHIADRVLFLEDGLVRSDKAKPSERETSAPIGEIEITLAALWAELLGVERVGRQDSFFALGGQSLLGVRLIALIHQRLGAELELSALFAAPTLAGLATTIAQMRTRSDPPRSVPPTHEGAQGSS